MPLTKSDLQQIGNIVEEKLQPIKTDVGQLKTDVAGLKTDVGQLKTDVAGLKTDVGQLKTDMTGVKKDLKSVKKDVRYLRKTINIVVKNYDEGDVRLDRRVTRIETHLGLPQNQN